MQFSIGNLINGVGMEPRKSSSVCIFTAPLVD